MFCGLILTKMNFVSFVKILLPYSVVSTVLIIIAIFVFTYDKEELDTSITDFEIGENSSKYKIIMYSVLFLIAISSVLRMIPWYVFVVVVLLCVGFFERKILFKADYILLLTFVGFFIFTGNMGKLEIVRSLLESVLKSHEFAVGIVTSQFISNVPATLMLSGFAKNYRQLLIGVNVGGLGTLIASMASLISYKAYVKEYRQGGGEFIKIFTLFNVVFLIALVGVNAYFYGGL